jgi:hypothetical protein
MKVTLKFLDSWRKFAELWSAGDDGGTTHTPIMMRKAATAGAVTHGQKLGYLCEFAIKLVGMFDGLPGKKSNSAEINTVGHPVRSDCCFFVAVIGDNLHLAQPNNTVQNEIIAADCMVFTRTTAATFFDANNIDNNALRVGGHGIRWLLVDFERKKCHLLPRIR